MKERNINEESVITANGAIWVDWMIREWAESGGITPYSPDLINPASINLRLDRKCVNMHDDHEFHLKDQGEEELDWIIKGDAILATTIEYVCMPENATGTLYLRSGAARRGLDHALAGFIDPGFEGEITLELHAHRPYKIWYGLPMIQLVLTSTAGFPEKSYRVTGHYNGQRGPTKARS